MKASETGFITHMDTEGIGVASVMLGAGRNKKEDTIDYSAGILLEKKYGDSVREGETIAVLYASHEELFGPAMENFWLPAPWGNRCRNRSPLYLQGFLTRVWKEGPLRKKFHKCSEKST